MMAENRLDENVAEMFDLIGSPAQMITTSTRASYSGLSFLSDVYEEVLTKI